MPRARTSVDRPRDTSALVDAAAAGTLAVGGALPFIPPGGVDRARTQRGYGVEADRLALDGVRGQARLGEDRVKHRIV